MFLYVEEFVPLQSQVLNFFDNKEESSSSFGLVIPSSSRAVLVFAPASRKKKKVCLVSITDYMDKQYKYELVLLLPKAADVSATDKPYCEVH